MHCVPCNAPSTFSGNSIVKFTNCRLVQGGMLVKEDLFVSPYTGKILNNCQDAFYTQNVVPDRIVDLCGRIVAPGLIDVQLNGAFGFDFSVLRDDMTRYETELKRINRELICTGVTSYLPTIVSQRSEVYRRALPYLGPSGSSRCAQDGAESLGAHCEGPFLSPTKSGAHNIDVLLDAPNGFSDLQACYGAENLGTATPNPSLPALSKTFPASRVKMITVAPELGQLTAAIPEIVSRGIICSIGHSEATYEQAALATASGASMITHLFNAMRPLHHRNPGVFGVLGQTDSRVRRPFFGIIADGEHLHSNTVKIAYTAFPDGCVLVTDAMHLAGLPDGIYDWTNGDRIVKRGSLLMLEGSDRIAGSAVTLIDCLSNFINWTGTSLAEAIKTVTATPARLLGLEKVKGSLNRDADADLCILTEKRTENGLLKLEVDQVWKFGSQVYDIQDMDQE